MIPPAWWLNLYQSSFHHTTSNSNMLLSIAFISARGLPQSCGNRQPLVTPTTLNTLIPDKSTSI